MMPLFKPIMAAWVRSLAPNLERMFSRREILLRRMACGYMSDLMRHDPGQFGLVIRRKNQPGVHVEKPARQGERVHIIGVNDSNCERHMSIGVAYHCAQPDMTRFGLSGAIHASFAFYNTMTEIEALADGLKRITTLFQ
jgi:Selenocysteine lyase